MLLGGEAAKTIQLRGDTLRHLNPDERTTAALLKKALAVLASPQWTMSTSGIFVRFGGLPELLADLKDAKLFYLREDGTDIREIARRGFDGEMAFILGDHTGMTAEEESLIASAGAQTVSLGATSMHADHCIVILNWQLDSDLSMNSSSSSDSSS